MAAPVPSPRCILALEDGTVFTGVQFGAGGTRTGEVVFNTSMTGYQEILTDPSYCGQIVAMTYPHIGNYGINREDVESAVPHVAGFAVRELARIPSSHRATASLADYLRDCGVIGIEGIDTRALARRLRVEGAMRGVITTEIDDPAKCVRLAIDAPGMLGADLVQLVAPKEASTWAAGLNTEFTPSRGGVTSRGGVPALRAAGFSPRERSPGITAADQGSSPGLTPADQERSCGLTPADQRRSRKLKHAAPGRNVVAIDCGMKRNILRHLVDLGCTVGVVPPTSSAASVLECKPDGVFVSNGPGDPAAVHYAVDLLRGLIGEVPIFGICLGHQLLGLALGANTFKLKFGHRGANQPVQNLTTGRVEITAQNHGFAIEMDSVESAGAAATHINLNDRTLEGFVHRELPILAVQYHPEASPGPHDANYLFDCFAMMMSTGRSPTGEDMADAQLALQQRAATQPGSSPS